MFGTTRLSTTVALIVCLVGPHASGVLFAKDHDTTPATNAAAVTHASASPATTPQRQLLSTTYEFTTDAAPARAGSLHFTPLDFDAAMQRRYPGRRPRDGRGRGSNPGAAIAIVAAGAMASITGSAILIYNNRPECDLNPYGRGCGYGTKVVGGSILTAGLIGMFAGAVALR